MNESDKNGLKSGGRREANRGRKRAENSWGPPKSAKEGAEEPLKSAKSNDGG